MSERVTLYGLTNCDRCRKARKALEAEGRVVEMRDIRAAPLSAAERKEFLAAFGDRLVNRQSTTWRGLSEAERTAPADSLIASHPALMKRPVLRVGHALHLGWDAQVRAVVLG